MLLLPLVVAVEDAACREARASEPLRPEIQSRLHPLAVAFSLFLSGKTCCNTSLELGARVIRSKARTPQLGFYLWSPART